MEIIPVGKLTEEQRAELRRIAERMARDAAEERKQQEDRKREHQRAEKERPANETGGRDSDGGGASCEGREVKVMNRPPKGLGAYRHITDDGRAVGIPDALVAGQLADLERRVGQSGVPSAELSLDRIARRIGRIELVLIALVNLLEQRCRPPEKEPVSKADEYEEAMRRWHAVAERAQPRVTFGVGEGF